MKQLQLIFTLTVALMCAAPAIISAQYTGAEVQNEEELKARKDFYKKHQAAVKAIQEDKTLTNEEKEAHLALLRSEIQKHQQNKQHKFSKAKSGKFRSAEEQAEWAFKKQYIKDRIRVIENDPSLSAAEKEQKKKKLLRKETSKIKKKRAKGKRERLKKKSDAYYLQENKDESVGGSNVHRKKSYSEKLQRKDSLTVDSEMKKKLWKHQQVEGFAKRKMTAERKAAAMKRLEKQEKALGRKLKKGQISQDKYDRQMEKIKKYKSAIPRELSVEDK